MVEIKEKIVIVDRQTGELYGPTPKKTKRTEAFFMVEQNAAIDLAKMKLTAMEHNILLYLQGLSNYENEVDKVSQKYLAAELQTTEATISICLKHLAEMGLVHKKPVRGVTIFVIDRRVSTRGKVK